MLEMKRLIRDKFGKYFGDAGVREFMGVCVFFDPRYSKVGITGDVGIRQDVLATVEQAVAAAFEAKMYEGRTSAPGKASAPA